VRRLLALPLLAVAAVTAAPAADAAQICTPAVIGACVYYECYDDCPRNVTPYLYCDMDSPPRVLACDLINQLGHPFG
jgi:hypothetical protein